MRPLSIASSGTSTVQHYLDLPILNTLVLQVGQVPLVAGRPFFRVTCCGFFISRFVLHLKQYASM